MIALCGHLPEFGGRGQYVEIGIVTLGTSPAGVIQLNHLKQHVIPNFCFQTQSKVEILGVFDQTSRQIRMKLLDVIGESGPTISGREKLDKVLKLIAGWVHRESNLLIDNTMDIVSVTRALRTKFITFLSSCWLQSSLERIGFKNIAQSKATLGSIAMVPTNFNVTNYLRNKVSNMFKVIE